MCFKAALFKYILLTLAITSVQSNIVSEKVKIHAASTHDAFDQFFNVHGSIADEGMADKSGSSISFSENGETVALCTWWDIGNGQRSGQVRVYNNNGNDKWNLVHSQIDFEAVHYGDDTSENLVSLANNGNILVIGKSASVAHNNSSRYVQVYENDNEEGWEQVHDGGLIRQTEVYQFGRALEEQEVCKPSSTFRTTLEGTCAEDEEIENQVAEGFQDALNRTEGFQDALNRTGIKATPAGLVSRCATRRALKSKKGKASTDSDRLLVDTRVTQEFDECTPLLTEDELLKKLEKNKKDIQERIQSVPGYEQVEVVSIELRSSICPKIVQNQPKKPKGGLKSAKAPEEKTPPKSPKATEKSPRVSLKTPKETPPKKNSPKVTKLPKTPPSNKKGPKGTKAITATPAPTPAPTPPPSFKAPTTAYPVPSTSAPVTPPPTPSYPPASYPFSVFPDTAPDTVQTPKGPKASTPKGPQASTPKGPKASAPKGPQASTPKGPKASTPKGPKASTPMGPKASTPKGPKASTPKGPKASTPKGPKA